MPNRILREGILSSERVCRLTFAQEVFYRRLHSVVDDYGRYYAKPQLLRAAAYPLQLDKVSDADIVKWLAASQDAGLVSVYQVEGKDYLQVLDFKQQQRAKASKFPESAAAATQMRSIRTADAHLVVGGVGVGVDIGDGVPPPAPGAARPVPKNGHRIEFDFAKGEFIGVSEADELRWQEAYPAVPIPPAILQAAAWLKGNPANRKSNYERFLVNWFKRDQDKAARVKR